MAPPVRLNCEHCAAELRAGARFCIQCGFEQKGAHQAENSDVAPVGVCGDAPLDGLAQLVVILRDGSEGGVFPVSGPRTDIGATEGDILLPNDPFLASRHARLERRGERFVLCDLGSTNGIYVRIRQRTALSGADMILLGQQVLRFELVSEAERQMGPVERQGTLVFGTPDTPRLARLVQYTTEGLARDVYYLHREETVLGREQADIVFSDDPFLSRRHAMLSFENGQFYLSDLGSSNGTAVRCRGEQLLTSGDQFRVGRHLLRFDVGRSTVGNGARRP